ncbi:hypothetical protein DMUE_6075 [Dictyocoela muelleri]|nr:hypothetical protein DMUE_6075 [Dictyocoela muelleri]
MLTFGIWEEATYILRIEDFIGLLMQKNMLKNSQICPFCNVYMRLVSYTHKDSKAWRCLTKDCLNYKKYFSIRLGSFFYGISKFLKIVVRIIIKFAVGTLQFLIKRVCSGDEKFVDKIIKKLIARIEPPNFENNPKGGPLHMVQIDETMMNYKCKSHRGRSPYNKTEALCIVEVGHNIT